VGATDSDDVDAAIEHDLVLVVWDVEQARALGAAARAAGKRASVHFKVDTGLTRLGAPLTEAAERCRAIRALPGISLDGVFSHLANADEPRDGFSPIQVSRFREFLDAIGERPRWVHLAASAGVESLGPLPFCTAIRPGLAMYGLHTAPHLADRLTLRPALSWRSIVRRVADVPSGTGVSYGHAFRASRDSRIATVPVGYGDGLARSGTGRLWLLCGGSPAPIAGRICMDLVMLDVTGREVAAGDEVCVIGEQAGARQSADDVAEAFGTISYEVLTGIKPRVPRHYLRDGALVATKTLADGFKWR
jgi:alanine racemase